MTSRNPIKISVAIIAHNEVENLGRALESVSWADQIVVIDCESTDGTAEIARGFGTEVYIEPNRENLNINKNIAIGKCTGQWIFILDADEVIPDELAGRIRSLINDHTQFNGCLIPRRNFVLGKWVRYGSQYPDYQLRLFRNGKGIFPAAHVHERLRVEGRIEKLDIPFDHYPFPDLSTMIEKNRRYVEFEAQYMYNNGKRLTNIAGMIKAMIGATFRFIWRYKLKAGFMDGMPGLILAWFDFSNQILRHFRLWEMTTTTQTEDD